MTEAQTARRGLSIFTKTFLTTLTVALIPVTVLGVRNVANEREQTTARVARAFEQETQVLAASVAGWIDLNAKALQHDALLPDIRSSVAARQIPVLHAIVNTYPWTFLASTIGSDGKNVARSDVSPPIDYSDRDYFKQAMSGKDLGQQVVISKTTGKPALVLAAPYPAEAGATGVLMTSSHLSAVTDAVAATRIGHSGFSFLLDDKGRVVAHRAPEYQGKLVELAKHPAYLATRSAPSARVTFNEGGKEFIAHALVTRLGWVIVVQQEAEEAFAPVAEAIRSAVIAALAVAVLALLASFLLARALTSPILRLTATADAISRGETGTTVAGVERGDEIGGLARAVDRMRVSIDVAMKRLRRASDNAQH